MLYRIPVGRWRASTTDNPVFSTFLQPPESGITVCYTMRLTQRGEDRETSDTPELADAVKQYDERDNERAS